MATTGRVVTLVSVAGGSVFYAYSGDPSWTLANAGTSVLQATGVVRSASNNQKLWFADGVNYVYFDPVLTTVFPWTASVGTLPVDSAGHTPTLICTWRGRTVVSGLQLDPQSVYMSAVSDPTNWQYLPNFQTPTQAVALTAGAPLGQVGDVVTALIPFTDDVLIFGCDHNIYMLTGDPMAGGQLQLVSTIIGIAPGNAWTMDPYGNIYFVSNRTGIYTLVPGNAPQRISQPIEQLLTNIDTGTNSIRLLWDDNYQGVHVFVTPLAGPLPAQHFFFENRTKAWWVDVFANANHNPLCCCFFDGNDPTDRVGLIGSWDGYARATSPTAATDDGTAIGSVALIGPILTKDMDDVLFKDMQMILGAASGPVAFDVLTGATPEIALAANPVVSGTWAAGRNYTTPVRRSGHALWVRLTASNPWAMEAVRLRVEGMGKVRRRGA